MHLPAPACRLILKGNIVNTPLRQHVLAASLLASAAFASMTASAQPAPATPVTPPPAVQAPAHAEGRGRVDPAERAARVQQHQARRLAALKDKLQLKPGQEPAWGRYTAAVRPDPGARPPRPDRAEWARLTTPQRLDRMQQFQAQRQASFAQRADATRAFYAALDADQQKVFDSEAFKGGPRHGHGPRHGDGPRGPQGHPRS